MRHAAAVGALVVTGFTRPAAAQTAPSSTGAPTSADEPVEVIVHGAKPSKDDLGGDAMRASDARSTPGAFGDPLQALATLPGVALMASGLPYFYLRGAPPADTGYFVDGIPVPALFHIGPGPSYLPAGLLSRVELFPSTAPAQYGRFVGGIMTAELAPPAFDAPAHGEASLRLFDASAFVEAPLGGTTGGDGWELVAAGRYGYPGLLLSLVAPDLSLGYGDYTVRVARRLGSSDTLSVLALGGYDHETDAAGNLPPIDSQFHRIDLRFDHRWASGSVRVGTTFGYDRTAGVDENTVAEVDSSTSSRSRIELEQNLGATFHLSAGADALVSHYAYAASSSGSPSPIGDEEMLGAYASLRITLAPGITIVPAVRVDDTQRPAALPGGSGLTVDPKLVARVAIARPLSWYWAMGIAHQEPSYVLPIPGVVVTAPTGFQEVDQLTGGFEYHVDLPSGAGPVDAKVTGFYNAAHDVSDFIAACGELLSCGPVGAADGRTYGLEILVRHDMSRGLSGWLSYTLSRAERYLGNVPYLSPFDRTHDLSAVLRYTFGDGFAFGLRITYYTGRPDFPSLDLVPPGAQASAGPEISFGPGQVAQHRLPAYGRIDWRFEKRWILLGGKASLSAVAEFFNTTLAKEAIDFQCSPLDGTCRASEIGPIALPSLGLEMRW